VLAERELALEIGDLFLPFRRLFAEPLILLLQSFNLLRLAIRQVAGASARWQLLLSP
jgi:hypothetical protein